MKRPRPHVTRDQLENYFDKHSVIYFCEKHTTSQAIEEVRARGRGGRHPRWKTSCMLSPTSCEHRIFKQSTASNQIVEVSATAAVAFAGWREAAATRVAAVRAEVAGLGLEDLLTSWPASPPLFLASGAKNLGSTRAERLFLECRK